MYKRCGIFTVFFTICLYHTRYRESGLRRGQGIKKCAKSYEVSRRGGGTIFMGLCSEPWWRQAVPGIVSSTRLDLSSGQPVSFSLYHALVQQLVRGKGEGALRASRGRAAFPLHKNIFFESTCRYSRQSSKSTQTS